MDDSSKTGQKGSITAGGAIQNISIAGFLQLIEMERKTCEIRVRNRNTGDCGWFYFEEGVLYDAVYRDLDGISAATALICWDNVTITFKDQPTNTYNKRITINLMALLLSSMVQRDENKDRRRTTQEETDLINKFANESWKLSKQVHGNLSGNTQENPVVINTQSTTAEHCENKPGQTGKEACMNVQKLNQVIETITKDLGEGLIATDIWTSADGVSIAGYNPQPKATALFNQMTSHLATTLEDSGFPGLGKYYIMDLVDNNMVVILPMGEYRWGMLVDSSKIQLGLLLNVVIPKIIDGFEEAITG